MPSKAVLKVIFIATYLAHNVLPTIPLKLINSDKVIEVLEHKQRRFRMFLTTYFLLFILSAAQLIYSSIFVAERNLIVIVFHGFLLMACYAWFAVFIGYHFLTNEFCCLLNNMISKSRLSVFTNVQNNVRRNLPCSHNDFLFIICACMVCVASSTIFFAIIPIISFTFPFTITPFICMCSSLVNLFLSEFILARYALF